MNEDQTEPQPTIESLSERLKQAIAERNKYRRQCADLQWAYSLTEGILEDNPAFQRVNERWNNITLAPIKAAKLAKDLKAENAALKKKPTLAWQDEFFGWLEQGFRTVQHRPDGLFRLRDEVRGVQVDVGNIPSFIEHGPWREFQGKRQ